MPHIGFFKTRGAESMKEQIETALKFYGLIEQLIIDEGLEDAALTVFDLEDIVAKIPGIDDNLAIAITQLASNNGKEYVSAHEIRARAKEFTQRVFKMTYCMYLMHREMITLEDILNLGLVDQSLLADEFRAMMDKKEA